MSVQILPPVLREAAHKGPIPLSTVEALRRPGALWESRATDRAHYRLRNVERATRACRRALDARRIPGGPATHFAGTRRPRRRRGGRRQDGASASLLRRAPPHGATPVGCLRRAVHAS